MADNIENIRTALKSAMPKLHACANVVASGIGYKVTNEQTDRKSVV